MPPKGQIGFKVSDEVISGLPVIRSEPEYWERSVAARPRRRIISSRSANRGYLIDTELRPKYRLEHIKRLDDDRSAPSHEVLAELCQTHPVARARSHCDHRRRHVRRSLPQSCSSRSSILLIHTFLPDPAHSGCLYGRARGSIPIFHSPPPTQSARPPDTRPSLCRGRLRSRCHGVSHGPDATPKLPRLRRYARGSLASLHPCCISYRAQSPNRPAPHLSDSLLRRDLYILLWSPPTGLRFSQPNELRGLRLHPDDRRPRGARYCVALAGAHY